MDKAVNMQDLERELSTSQFSAGRGSGVISAAVGLQRWDCIGGIAAVGLLRWDCSGGIVAVGLLRWDCSGGIAAVGLQRWDCSGGIAAVGLLRWDCCGGIAAVGLLRWDCCGGIALHLKVIQDLEIFQRTTGAFSAAPDRHHTGLVGAGGHHNLKEKNDRKMIRSCDGFTAKACSFSWVSAQF